MHKHGRQLKYTSASHQGGCTQKRIIMIVAPHHPKANVGVVFIHQYYQQIIKLQEQQLICCVNKIETNAAPVRRSRDHKHIGLLVKGNLSCQLSCHHLESIKITCARQVWQFITQLMTPFKKCNGRVPCKDWPKLDQGRNSCGSDEGSPRVIFRIRINCSFCF